ncbi:TRAP transporter substrate-binding protein [Bacillus sp. NSP9.1]|uniref:TRAP transporter substrate-binding protein n=1 Tax=Bacillus sp. NSP9.1 TaxID=1071078 RepID=UPI0004019559|nr:TRAP transporter substrate-binding protein [Bacillus sp. NSP9.1]QHZ48466.1 TRAP transporter substrate-binding protein [Bacillus sp. NSP9.1]
MKKLRYAVSIIVVLLALSIVSVFAVSKTSSEEVVTIRFGHGAAESNERHQAVMKFKELVEKASNNEIKVEVYPNEQLGSEAEMVESVTMNSLQMVAAAAFNQYDQRISAFELPYLFHSKEQAWQVLDGEIGQEVAAPLLEDNLRVLAYFENGFRHITSNKPIETPEDLAGVKIRTPEVPVSIDSFRAMGANPTPMAFGELYMALQQGTVDAQENPIANIYAARFNEVQQYLNKTYHQYTPLPVAINEGVWQSLSSNHQEILKSSAKKAAQFHRDLIDENEKKMEEELEDQGMEVIEPDTAPFKEKVEVVYEKYKKEFGEEFINMLLEAAE